MIRAGDSAGLVFFFSMKFSALAPWRAGGPAIWHPLAFPGAPTGDATAQWAGLQLSRAGALPRFIPGMLGAVWKEPWRWELPW